VLALGEKLLEPRFCLRDCVGARHAQHLETVRARLADEGLLERGRIF